MRPSPTVRRLPGIVLTVVAVATAGALGGHLAAGQTPTPPDPLLRLSEEIAAEVEALRGWRFKAPVVKARTSVEEARRYMERRVETELPPGRLALQQAMLRTIGLLPRDVDLKATLLGVLENQVGGYYDPETKTLHLVERVGGMPAVAERLILAHELTHALDDQHVDLDRMLKGLASRSEDLDLVAAALSEGSATGLMAQYLVRLQAAGRVDMATLQEYAAREAERSKPLLDAPPYFSVLVASYVCGMQFLAKGNLMVLALSPDNKAFGESFVAAVKNPPRSSEQILHPAKYWEPGAIDEPVMIDELSVVRWLERPGFHLVHTDTMGELLAAVLAAPKDRQLDPTRVQLPSAWTSPAATGWGGDRFFLLAEGRTFDEAKRLAGRLCGVWVTAWDTVADRDEWLQALPVGSLPPGHRAVPLGARAAVILIGFGEADGLALVGSLKEGTLTFSQGGAAWSPAK